MKKALNAYKKNKGRSTLCYIMSIGLSLTFSWPMSLLCQTMHTVAGNGTAGFSGDGGASTLAELQHPDAVAVDAAGNIYIADTYNHRIRRAGMSGLITTIAGNGTMGYNGDGGPAVSAELNYPTGIALDASGNIYIVDEGNSRIRKVDVSGIITTVAGNGLTGYSGDSVIATSAKLNSPRGIAIDAAGNLYIADWGNSRIRKVNTAGIISTVAGSGTGGFSGDGGLAINAELNLPYSVALDGTGSMYIGEEANNRVRKVNISGVITTFAGNGSQGYSGDGASATLAELRLPLGIGTDGLGNVYIADWGNNCIRKVNASGIITTIAGNGFGGFSGDGGTPSSAKLFDPSGVLVALGNIYISDSYNNRIREISSVVGTGVNELTNSMSVNIYPIPCNRLITADLKGAGYTSIRIYDVFGREVYTQCLNSAQQDLNLHIDIGDIFNGVYFIQISTLKEVINKRIEVRN